MADIHEIHRMMLAHGLWKVRLRLAISSGKADLSIETITDHHGCELGSWLDSRIETTADDDLGHIRAIRDCHSQFHELAGQVTSLATAGRMDEANELMRGRFEAASVKLTSTMSGLGTISE